MNQTVLTPDPLLVNIVLAILAIGLPILIVLCARFLWNRNLHLGRSKELEKLIWQLHRIASALEHQMNLSFPSVQPGTEDPRDVGYLRPLPTQQNAPSAAVSSANAAARVTAAPEVTQAPTPAPAPVAQQPAVSAPVSQESSDASAPRRAGVNSMFDL
jgi:hypothetical protein